MITLLSAGVVKAQENSNPSTTPSVKAASIVSPAIHNGVEKRLEKLDQQLNLTVEQKAKILPILKHEGERIRVVRGNSSLSEGEVQRRIRTIHRETNQRIGDFLTPKQKKQWQESRQQQRAVLEDRDHAHQDRDRPEASPPA